MQRLLDIMQRLRDPDNGCPWDIRQTFKTIAPYTIEEAYEVADAIDRDDMVDLKDELGDLLLQVVYHSQMASEAGHFDFSDVMEHVSDKLVRRHPHVFDSAEADSPEQVKQLWESIKAGERRQKDSDDSALAGLAPGLPAWIRAQKLHKRAAQVGFDWDDVHGILDKVAEELDEVRQALANDEGNEALEAEYGDLLFVCFNIGRHIDIDPDTALRGANRKFEQRFRAMETIARDRGVDMQTATLAELDLIWDEVKQQAVSTDA